MAACAPPATNATPSRLAAPVVNSLVDVLIMLLPFFFSAPVPGRCHDSLSAV